MVFYLKNARAYLIQKIAVVADYQHRAGIRLQIPLQPLHGDKIQMVCGLVQDENIRALQKQLRKAQARVLAAREDTHALSPFSLRERHTVQYFFDARIYPVTICRVYHGLKLTVALHKRRGIALRHLCLYLLQLPHGGQHRCKRLLHFLIYRALWMQCGVLFQIAHAHTAGKAQLARIRLIFAGDELQKRCFTSAVLADNPDAVLFVHIKADVREAQLGAKIFLYSICL